ncbi:MAG: helix-turn-helix domain-containing protein [Streptococcus orisratti]|uniref:helix-turn-helix domain-containing protein n=1 Tax=Streptococcus orisratti TaxID=114652 RepID=UPI002357D3F8|nr:helix-turn-helix domain-containing protein [Streptococcus orisratti]MCI7677367.1 helix-turn-helix domain-containing protein [Streptococcus orisratti]MDY4001696.1 helix-turn-helix domain-containing protein [Streptococcus orisratti]MDY5635121.1 helix-turn-helix domain-containing protein [Streptococcus orisratti]
MKIETLFPEAVIRQDRDLSLVQDYLELLLDEQYVYLPKASLSKREQLLLGLSSKSLLGEPQMVDAWQTYFLQKQGRIPQSFECVQMVYIEHRQPLSQELKEFFTSLLVNLEALVDLSPTRTLLLLNQETFFDVETLVQDILPTIESDFGMKLTVFFGNSWTKLKGDELRIYFDNENSLFSEFIHYKADENLISFSQAILWGLAHRSNLSAIKSKILQDINESKDIRDIIVTMWEEHGNLVQTAQKLFIHRNSLQYKLDKFASLSGLNLKKLDDLAFCYLLILTD